MNRRRGEGSMTSKAEGDRIAALVLEIVKEVAIQSGRAVQQKRAVFLEPTGIRVDRDVEDAVMRRSA